MPRILLVDDEASILSMLTTVLHTEGFDDTISALGGQAALDLLAKYEFDLMISDIRMTPVDGMELSIAGSVQDKRHSGNDAQKDVSDEDL